MSEENNNELSVSKDGVFNSIGAFESAQRMAVALSKSKMIPAQYQEKPQDVLVAMEIAGRTGTSVIMVMQNMDIIKGNPSWRSQYVIASLNASGRFSTDVRFKYEDLEKKEIHWKQTVWEGGQKQKKSFKKVIQNKRCTAYMVDLDGNKMEGPEVTIEMAYTEGWFTKEGSKWPTMTKLMMSYRAAKFFGNLYAPDILMGMNSADEIQDIHQDPKQSKSAVVDAEFEDVSDDDSFENEDDDGDGDGIL